MMRATRAWAEMKCALAVVAITAILPIYSPARIHQARPPTVYTTPVKVVSGWFRIGKETSSDAPLKLALKIEGRATYTLTAASDDDSLTGTFTISLLPQSKQSLADTVRVKLAEIPDSFSRTGTVAKFVKSTSCPSIELDFPEFVIDVKGGHLSLSGKLLRIPETADKLVQQLCFWTRQINVKRERLGIIRSINRMIEGDNP